MLKKLLKIFLPKKETLLKMFTPKPSDIHYYCPHCFEHIGAKEHGKRRLPKHINMCSFNPDNSSFEEGKRNIETYILKPLDIN